VDSPPIPRKRLGGIAYSPLIIESGPGTAPALFDWINASWTGKAQRKDGSIVSVDARLATISQRDFFQALITETTIPALDGASKDPVYLIVTLAPELTRESKSPAKISGEPARQKLWVASNFRVSIDDVDCTRVMRVDSMTVRQAVGEPIGTLREPGQAGPLDFPNVRVTVSQAGSETWSAWFEDFVVRGNSGQGEEKNGAIALLSPDLKDEMIRIDLFGLGIVSLGPGKNVAGSEKLATVTAEMYCQRMELHVADKTPKPQIVR
jgi:hypothetical protein